MEKTIEEVDKVFDHDKANGKVWVSYFKNVQDLLDNGIDKEILDEEWFVWGSDIKPSDLKGSFIIIEVEGTTDLPIFTEDRKEGVIEYLKDNHSEYINNKEES